MSNEIYLAKDLADVPERLTREQRRKLVLTIDSLGDSVLENSYVIAADSTQGGGLRATHAGDLRILFRYTPESHSVVITDISSMAHQELAASA